MGRGSQCAHGELLPQAFLKGAALLVTCDLLRDGGNLTRALVTALPAALALNASDVELTEPRTTLEAVIGVRLFELAADSGAALQHCSAAAAQFGQKKKNC